ncbi:helix-turn-helix transcriptional regulator [Brevibacillus parabrevis]|uniref:helix-turn-helix transcriptional regulator n=1 Tax=Brevibacillus parabrevis TaxID=54914 RepID=UPI000A055B0D|nr:AraC family transcriptional regulator [Brevibacillus parabrevis]
MTMEFHIQLSDMQEYFPQFLASMQATLLDRSWEQQAIAPAHIGSGGITRLRIRPGMEIVMTDLLLEEDMKYTIQENFQLLELNYSLSGQTYCAWNGKEKQIASKEGSVVFLADEKVYLERKAGIRNQHVEIRMSPEHFLSYSEQSEDGSIFEAFLNRHQGGVEPYDTSPAIQKCIHDMFFCTYQGPLKRLYMESKAMEIIALVSQNLGTAKARSSVKLRKQDVEMLARVQATIVQNLENPYSIRQLSRMAGMNESKLKQGFREMYGMSIFEQVRQARVEKALVLMETEQLTIGQAAAAVGYSNASNFTAAFRKQYGMNPSEYVRRQFS